MLRVCSGSPARAGALPGLVFWGVEGVQGVEGFEGVKGFKVLSDFFGFFRLVRI